MFEKSLKGFVQVDRENRKKNLLSNEQKQKKKGMIHSFLFFHTKQNGLV